MLLLEKEVELSVPECGESLMASDRVSWWLGEWEGEGDAEQEICVCVCVEYWS